MNHAGPATSRPVARQATDAASTARGRAAAAWRRVTVATVGALVLLAIAWEWKLAPLRPGGSLLLLKAVPLAMLWPGLARGRLRSFQIGSMLILAYLAEGIVRGMTDAGPSSRLLGWVECALAAMAFAAMLAHVRSRRTAQAASGPPLETPTS